MIEDWGACVSPEGVATLNCIPVVMQNIVNALIMLAGIVAVFLIVFSGYKFVMSEGDPEKVASARKTLTYAIVGFLLILASFLIRSLIAQYTGVTQIAPK